MRIESFFWTCQYIIDIALLVLLAYLVTRSR